MSDYLDAWIQAGFPSGFLVGMALSTSLWFLGYIIRSIWFGVFARIANSV